MSKARAGKIHDKSFHDQDDIAGNVPDEIPLQVDLGFQGLHAPVREYSFATQQAQRRSIE